MSAEQRKHPGWPLGKARGPFTDEHRRRISEARRAQEARRRRVRELAAELAELLSQEAPAS